MQVRRIVLVGATAGMLVVPATAASAHVHGITPLLRLADECGVTNVANTGANRAQSDRITGLIPRDVGQSGLEVGDGGVTAPVGCTD